MNYVESLNLFGVPAKEIPCILGDSAPTAKTEGAVGCLYMDTNTGNLYKCTASEDGVYTWKNASNSIDHPYTDDECRNAFYAAMNAKLGRMNILGATIEDAAGYPGHNFLYPVSIVKIAEIASSYRELSDIWSAKEYTIKTHDVVNTIPMTSTVTNGSFTSKLTNHYSLLCGKTGSGIGSDGKIHNLLTSICTSSELEGRAVVTVVSLKGGYDSESSNRFTATKLMMDIAVARYKNRDADVSGLQTQLTTMGMESGCCYLVPHFTPHNLYSHSMSSDNYHQLYLYQGALIETFSTIKVLTAIVVLDYVCDLDEHLTFKQSDLLEDAGPYGAGTGAYFAVGQTITIRDALYALMLPSSNQCAYALARHVGEKLLRLTNYSTS